MALPTSVMLTNADLAARANWLCANQNVKFSMGRKHIKITVTGMTEEAVKTLQAEAARLRQAEAARLRELGRTPEGYATGMGLIAGQWETLAARVRCISLGQ